MVSDPFGKQLRRLDAELLGHRRLDLLRGWSPSQMLRFGHIVGFSWRPEVDPFWEPAAALREQPKQAVTAIDRSGTDPALRNPVLVGHSMGGLIALVALGSRLDA